MWHRNGGVSLMAHCRPEDARHAIPRILAYQGGVCVPLMGVMVCCNIRKPLTGRFPLALAIFWHKFHQVVSSIKSSGFQDEGKHKNAETRERIARQLLRNGQVRWGSQKATFFMKKKLGCWVCNNSSGNRNASSSSSTTTTTATTTTSIRRVTRCSNSNSKSSGNSSHSGSVVVREATLVVAVTVVGVAAAIGLCFCYCRSWRSCWCRCWFCSCVIIIGCSFWLVFGQSSSLGLPLSSSFSFLLKQCIADVQLFVNPAVFLLALHLVGLGCLFVCLRLFPDLGCLFLVCYERPVVVSLICFFLLFGKQGRSSLTISSPVGPPFPQVSDFLACSCRILSIRFRYVWLLFCRGPL